MYRPTQFNSFLAASNGALQPVAVLARNIWERGEGARPHGEHGSASL